MAVYPLNHGRILWDNLATEDSVTLWGDSYDPNHLYANVLTPETYTYWQVGDGHLSPRLNFVFANPTTIANVGINGMSYRDSEWTIYTSVIGDFSDVKTVATIPPDSSTCMMTEFEPEEIKGVRIHTQRSTSSINIAIANVFIGNALEMERPHFSGVNPPSISLRHKIEPLGSASGHFLGRRILKTGVTHKADYRHLTWPFYNQKFKPFSESAVTKPFFYSWNMLEDPNGTIYGQTTTDITPSMMGIGDFLQVGFTIEGQK